MQQTVSLHPFMMNYFGFSVDELFRIRLHSPLWLFPITVVLLLGTHQNYWLIVSFPAGAFNPCDDTPYRISLGNLLLCTVLTFPKKFIVFIGKVEDLRSPFNFAIFNLQIAKVLGFCIPRSCLHVFYNLCLRTNNSVYSIFPCTVYILFVSRKFVDYDVSVDTQFFQCLLRWNLFGYIFFFAKLIKDVNAFIQIFSQNNNKREKTRPVLY